MHAAAASTAMRNSEAVILAGGLGTRLRAVVSDRPKVLAQVCGRPWITYLLDQLEQVKPARIILATGYCAEMVQAALGDDYHGIPLLYSREVEPLGTGGALALAAKQVRSQNFVALNGDSYCDVDLGAVWNFHLLHRAPATQVVVEQPDTSRYGAVIFDEAGRISRFSEKGGTTGKGWINAGIYVLNTELFGNLAAPPPLSLERDLFPIWLERGMYAFQTPAATFIDIGTPHSYEMAQNLFSLKK